MGRRRKFNLSRSVLCNWQLCRRESSPCFGLEIAARRRRAKFDEKFVCLFNEALNKLQWNQLAPFPLAAASSILFPGV